MSVYHAPLFESGREIVGAAPACVRARERVRVREGVRASVLQCVTVVRVHECECAAVCRHHGVVIWVCVGVCMYKGVGSKV